MKFDLVIPTYNEASIIAESLERCGEVLSRAFPGEWRILVCDNGSIDGTADVVTRLGNPRYLALHIDEKGKGAALIAGARASESKLFGYLDADLSADPSDLVTLVNFVRNGEADIAVGSRLMDERLVRRGFLRTLSSRLFNLVRYLLLGISVEDTQCGLKAMNAAGRDLLRSCTERTWFIDVELLARAERAGLRIREVPIHWNEFRFPDRRSKLHVLRAGAQALAAFHRIRKQVG